MCVYNSAFYTELKSLKASSKEVIVTLDYFDGRSSLRVQFLAYDSFSGGVMDGYLIGKYSFVIDLRSVLQMFSVYLNIE